MEKNCEDCKKLLELNKNEVILSSSFRLPRLSTKNLIFPIENYNSELIQNFNPISKYKYETMLEDGYIQ